MSNIPILKKNNPVLIAPTIRSYSIPQGAWKITLETLEIKYNKWINTYNAYNAPEIGMQDVNDIMQEYHPGPYRVVEKYLKDRMVVGFELEFDDPKEKTMWLLRWS